jgi:hypothetical protein
VRRAGAEIGVVDATGWSWQAKTAPTWAPMGQTPILRRLSKHRELSPVIALPLSGHLFKQPVPQAVGGTDRGGPGNIARHLFPGR